MGTQGKGRDKTGSVRTLTPKILFLAVGCLLLGTATANARTRGWVLPGVAPDKMQKLLNPGPGKLPGAYRFDGAKIDKVAIRARYGATGQPHITVLLSHPSQTRGKPVVTRKFALRLLDRESKAAPRGPELLRALGAHVRSQEATWQWVRVTLKPSEVKDLEQRYNLVVKPESNRHWYGIYLLFLLLLGPLVSWWFGRRRPEATPRTTAPTPSPGWDRFDLGALALISLFLATVVWPMTHFPMTGDEATNLEPQFWSQWFRGGESGAHPPLFRFLIHLTAREVEPLWLLRGPVALFAAGGLWLFWRLARARASGWVALALTGALALSGNHWQHAFQQKSLWLWLLLLLAAHHSFERALAGTRTRWAHYAFWATLAVLTHYLSVAYLAGHFLVVLVRHRKALLSQVLALLPAALAVLPLTLALAENEVRRVSGYGPNDNVVSRMFTEVVLNTGLAAVLLALPAALLSGRDDSPPDTILPVVGLGFAATLALSTQMVLWPRYFFPVLPFLLLWLAGRLRWSTGRALKLQVAVLVLAGVFHLRITHKTGRQTLRQSRGSTLYAAYLKTAPARTAESRPNVVLVHPGWRFPMLYHRLTGRRHLRVTGCPGQRSPHYHLRGPELLVAVKHDVSMDRLRQLAQQVGSVYLLLYEVQDGSSSKAVQKWAKTHCRVLIRHRSPGRTETGTAYRCSVAPVANGDPCAAVQKFDRR